jgi:hypothetical protein
MMRRQRPGRIPLTTIGVEGITGLSFDASVFDKLAAIAEHEAAHVETLTQMITDLGGELVTESTYSAMGPTPPSSAGRPGSPRHWGLGAVRDGR